MLISMQEERERDLGGDNSQGCSTPLLLRTCSISLRSYQRTTLNFRGAIVRMCEVFRTFHRHPAILNACRDTLDCAFAMVWVIYYNNNYRAGHSRPTSLDLRVEMESCHQTCDAP